MAEHVSGLREVLAAHVWDAASYDAYEIHGCDCGWEIVGASPEVDRVAAYQDHLAAAVLAWVAERLGSAEMREGVAEAMFDDDPAWRCAHEWMLRPESDTHICLICGDER